MEGTHPEEAKLSSAASSARDRVRQKVSEAEWHTRVELAALYRALHHFGMTELIANHITARVPGEPEHMLLNAYGLMYDEITASNLYKIDMDGKVIMEPEGGFPLNATGYVIHGAIHSVRHDVEVVIHTHTRAGIAVSAMKCGLLPLSQHSVILGEVSYHDFQAPALDFDERQSIIDDMGDTDLMILRNHGLMVCGSSIAQAFSNIFRLETACRIQVDALSGGAENAVALNSSHFQATRNLVLPHVIEASAKLQWEAVRRMLERSGAVVDA